jgi:hypothetical protein
MSSVFMHSKIHRNAVKKLKHLHTYLHTYVVKAKRFANIALAPCQELGGNVMILKILRPK